jgi:hypothetical protein
VGCLLLEGVGGGIFGFLLATSTTASTGNHYTKYHRVPATAKPGLDNPVRPDSSAATTICRHTAAMAQDLYTRTLAHLSALSDDPSLSEDTKLFDEASLILPTALKGSDDLWNQRLLLMRNLASDLQDSRRTDHTASVNLLIKLFEVWTWQQVCEFGTSSVPYKDGLAVGDGMGPFNRLMIELLSKATGNASDAAHAASMLEAMQALVRLFLCTNDTGVAMQAGQLLLDLLKVDRPRQGIAGPDWRSGGGQGLVWKRIFGDRDVYNVFFEACSLDVQGEVQLSKNQKTIAQGRLLEWLPKVGGMNWTAVTHSHHRDVENKFGVQSGLLDFAALKMVDYKEDVLMHQCLVLFFSALLSETRPLDTGTMQQHDSFGLQYLIMHGLHARTAAIYLQLPGSNPHPLEITFLYGAAAEYVGTYASNYPDHFLASQMPAQILDRLRHTLDLSPAKWAHSDSPKHDLNLLASLPRKALLPNGDGSGDWNTSPVSLLPSKSTNADVLNTLATLFHGPQSKTITYPPSTTGNGTPLQTLKEAEEGAAARALYYHYLANNPRFWGDVIKHADTVALKDLALVAVNCISAVITATWPPADSTSDFVLPSSIATPASGHLAILAPPALEYVLPYLLSPPKTFANLVGGTGDSESAAYQVAVAKFEAVRLLHERLKGQMEVAPGEGYEAILETVAMRLQQGVLPQGAEVGGRVGTLEL